MSDIINAILASFAILGSISLPSIDAYNCYIASSSSAEFPSTGQWTWGYNCTSCVRGKYEYTNGGTGTIWIWGCLTGSSGMISPPPNFSGGVPRQYRGQPGQPTAWGTAPSSWVAAPSTWVAPPSSWGAPPSSWGNWGSLPGVPPGPGPVAWTDANTWTAGGPWANWGSSYAAPAQPFYNWNANMCVDGSFEGYSNSLRAYAYTCTCCKDGCNQDLTCATFGAANSIHAVKSSVAALLSLTFAVVSLRNA